MTGEDRSRYEFAAAADVPIQYLRRIREYYEALGYGAPYEWAHYDDAPFQPLEKPLSECRVAIVTTAAPYQPGKGDQGPGAPYNAEPKFYKVYSGDTGHDHDLRISHVAIDRAHTTAASWKSGCPKICVDSLQNSASERSSGSRRTGGWLKSLPVWCSSISRLVSSSSRSNWRNLKTSTGSIIRHLARWRDGDAGSLQAALAERPGRRSD